MQIPNWTDPQFIDATAPGGLNPAFSLVSGSIASLGSGAWAVPGLLAPEAMTVSFAGMVATVTLPPPWGLVNGSGTVVRAHGALTGADTQTYIVDFSPLVPGTGTLEAYLIATVDSIQQNPIPIPGPPPGHPSYDPNFVPMVGYASNVDSVSLGASSTPAFNGTTSFELLRTTLTAGQTSVSTFSTGYQVRAGNYRAQPYTTVSGSYALVPSQAQQMLITAVASVTSTLPPTSAANGLFFSFCNLSNTPWIIATAGSDIIYGILPSPANSLQIPVYGSVTLWSDGSSVWYVTAQSANFQPVTPNFQAISASTTWTVPAGVTYVDVEVFGAGGGGGGSQVSAAGGGGSGGGYARNIVPVTPGTGYVVIVGTGGAGGAGGTGNSGSGSSSGTSFAGILVVNGAGGGAGATTGNLGAGGISGTVTVSSGGLSLQGGYGTSGNNSGSIYMAGNGGGSFSTGNISGSLAQGSSGGIGEGGAGGANGGGGGNGGNGLIILRWNQVT